jgi:hypothetical protein
MKRKDLMILSAVALMAAVFSLILSGVIFGSPSKNPVKVPEVQKITSTFPVVSNDDDYKKIFNPNALDPTQLIKIGGSNNTSPFQDTGAQ